jgi:hypothetical protein
MLLAPTFIVPLLPQLAYYYYLELVWPARAAALVAGAAWLSRALPRGVPACALAAAFAVVTAHLAGGLVADHRTGLLRGRLDAMDLRGHDAPATAPNLITTWASRREVSAALAGYAGIDEGWLRRNARGPWWAAFVDDGCFWLREARRRRRAPRPRPPGLLYVGHADDPFPSPARPGGVRTAGRFRISFFTPSLRPDLARVAVCTPGAARQWAPLPADLEAWSAAAAPLPWPAVPIRVRAPLEVTDPPPERITIQVLAGYGARPTGLALDGSPLAPGPAWARQGVELACFTWTDPRPGRHRVEIEITGPEDRRVPVWFEFYDVSPAARP